MESRRDVVLTYIRFAKIEAAVENGERAEQLYLPLAGGSRLFGWSNQEAIRDHTANHCFVCTNVFPDLL